MSRRQGTGLEPIRIDGKRIQHVGGERTNYLIERVARKLATTAEEHWPNAIEMRKVYDLRPTQVHQAKALARMLMGSVH